MRWNAHQAHAFLAWLLERHARIGGRTEIRALGRGPRGGVWSAFVGPEDLEDVVDALAPFPGGPRPSVPDWPRSGEANLYFGLNPTRLDAVPPRGATLFTRDHRATRDKDVLAYTMLAIDVDPEREPHGRAATDAEKAEALAVAEAVREELRAASVESLFADSGNGYHLLVPLVPALDVASAGREAHAILRAFCSQFSTKGARVDTSTYNPSRILKLYGSLAMKGEPTAEHPHRLASIDLGHIPEDVDLVARLAARAGYRQRERASQPAPPPPSPKPARSPAKSPWTDWRARALAALPLEAVYGELLTGKVVSAWRQCRDPASPSGDHNPSAGVADAGADAERCTFHSFRDGRTLSVFDFLIERGVCADFRAACAHVASLAGIPVPGPAAVGEGALGRLEAAWATQDEARRNRAVRECLAAALHLPAIEQRQSLDAVAERTGLSHAVLQRTLGELRKAERREVTRARVEGAVPRGRVVVDFIENRDTVDGLFDAIVAAILPSCRFFRFEREIVFVRRGFGPRPVDERSLPGLLTALVEVRFLTETDDGVVFQRFDVLPADLARAFVHSPRVAAKLPLLAMYARSPVFDASWNFVGKPGYHPASGIFYDGPEVEPAAGVERTLAVVQDFPWKDAVDMVNFMGALLTSLTMPHWGRGHPFLAINGNKPGVGKSTLARVLGVVAEGAEPTTVTFTANEEEFEKQLATRVEAGDRVVVVDNARTTKPIQSAVLERCITDTRLNFRRLGGNTAITRPSNDVLFVVTMNLTQMGADLRRRALPLNLFIEGDVRRWPYRSDDPVGDALATRAAVIAELAGMVEAWLEAGQPMPEAPAAHSTSRKWAATIDAILHHAGFDGFLSNFADSEHAYDPDFELLADVCAGHHDDPPRTAGEWANVLVRAELEEKLTDGRGNAKPARSQATIVGQLFTAYLDGTTFAVGDSRYRLRRDEPRKGHPPLYCFERVP